MRRARDAWEWPLPMCLIAVALHSLPGCPVAVAANREEYFDRPGLPPQVSALADGGPRAMFGRDPRAGGTWLGVNERGLLIGVTNVWFVEPPPAPRSRGALALDLLACRTAEEAARLAERELRTGRYAGVNYICVDAAAGYVVHHATAVETRTLEPGLHVVTNGPPDDASDVRQQYFRALYAEHAPRDAAEFIATARAILPRGSGVYGDSTIVLRAADRGTVSSSIIALPDAPSDATWWHAPGSPDRTAYEDYSAALRGLLADDRHTSPKR